MKKIEKTIHELGDMTFDLSSGIKYDHLDGDGNEIRGYDNINYDLILEDIPINVIEQFLRKKKLKILNKK